MVTKVISIIKPKIGAPCERPIFMESVRAGFPSPAQDYIEGTIDLNKLLIKHPAATFFIRVAGDSMMGAGIHPEDILIVDRSIEAVDKKIVIAVVDGELTVKRIRMQGGHVYLEPENPNYPPIIITEEIDLVVWGVVTSVIHPV